MNGQFISINNQSDFGDIVQMKFLLMLIMRLPRGE